LIPVLHLITTIERGGAENQLLVLVKAQISSGREVHIAYLKGNPELKSSLTDVGAFVHSGLADLNPISQLINLRKLLRNRNWILHAHLPRAELIAAAALIKCKLVVSRHNSEKFFPKAPLWLSRVLSRFVCYRALSVIAISEAVGDFLIDSREISNLEKLKVIHYGYVPSNSRDFLEKPLPPIPTKLGTVSRLVPQKDLDTLFKVFADYHVICPESTLSIVGSGPMESELRDLACKLGLADSIFFEGRSADVFGHIKSWDVFFLTSIYEGFGMVLLEAMDAAVPIIASNNSAIPEVLGKTFPGLGTTGDRENFLSLLKQYCDPNFRLNILRIQEDRLFHFNAADMCVEIDNVYEKRLVT